MNRRIAEWGVIEAKQLQSGGVTIDGRALMSWCLNSNRAFV
jgi:hypothetical protein